MSARYRYVLVPVFTDPGLIAAFATTKADTCVECGRPVRHAFDSYYQRNNVPEVQPVTPDHPDFDLANALMVLTYDCVCKPCGDEEQAKP